MGHVVDSLEAVAFLQVTAGLFMVIAVHRWVTKMALRDDMIVIEGIDHVLGIVITTPHDPVVEGVEGTVVHQGGSAIGIQAPLVVGGATIMSMEVDDMGGEGMIEDIIVVGIKWRSFIPMWNGRVLLNIWCSW